MDTKIPCELFRSQGILSIIIIIQYVVPILFNITVYL